MKKNSIGFVVGLAFICAIVVGVGMFVGSRYIDNKMLESNKKDAMDLSLFVNHNFHITDKEAAYMKSLTFNEMEKDAINHRLTDIGTGLDLDAPIISIYIVAPLSEGEVKYHVDENLSDFFGVEPGTPLDAIWLLNAAVAEDGTPIFAKRDDVYRYTPMVESLKKSFSEQKAFGFYSEDEWGEVITGFSPVYSEEGNFVGTLGIDMDISTYQRDVHSMVSIFIAAFSIITVSLFALFLFFYIKYIKTQKAKMYFEFYSRMSHDMRTPMNGILGMVHLAKGEENPEELKEYISKIGESSQYLLHLINDTLDVSKISSGKMMLNESVVSCEDIFQNIEDMLREFAARKKVKFEVNNINLPQKLYIEVDPIHFKQLFVNLLSNAIKYTPAGGIVRFSFEYSKREGHIYHMKFIVSDTGVGMSKGFVEHELFQPFAQEQNGMSDLYLGTGLGLSIAKHLIELMGGSVTVCSALGEGTTFTVYLDLKSVEISPDIELQKKERGSLESLKGRHILVCEDHPLNAEIVTKLLERVGCIVTNAANGKLGVDTFKASEMDAFDAILMDVRMPVLDGLEAAREIRSLERSDAAEIPIIAMTANAYAEDRKRTREAGMNQHLSKPIDPQVLYETLIEEMGKKR